MTQAHNFYCHVCKLHWTNHYPCPLCTTKDPMNNNQSPIEIIQLGGVYETHDHRKVQCVYIYANCGQAVYIFPDNPEAEPIASDYRGKTYCGERRIIGEWKERPVVDWSKFAAWQKYAAKDSNNLWQAYMEKPTLKDDYWRINEEDQVANKIPKEYAPKFSGHWKDSLCERPK